MKKDWREIWEDLAEEDQAELDSLPVEILLEKVKSGVYGDYYNIWRSIAERSDLEGAGWILFDVLNRDIDYLYRYHCAAALISLSSIKDYEAVDLSSENHNCKENIISFSRLLEKKLGARVDF